MVSTGKSYICKAGPGRAYYWWNDTLNIQIPVSVNESALTSYTGFPPSAIVVNAPVVILETLVAGDLFSATDGLVAVATQFGATGLFIRVGRTLAPASTRNVSVQVSALIEDAE